MLESERLSNKRKKQVKNYYIGLFCFAIAAILCLILSNYFDKKDRENTSVFTEIKNDANQLNTYSTDYVYLMSDAFAEYEKDGKKQNLYFLANEKEWFIAILDEETEKKLEPIHEWSYSDEENAQPRPIKIEGRSQEIDDELKKIAIEDFNLFYGEEIITEDNFNSFFGALYIDTSMGPNSISSLFDVFFVIFAIGFIAIFIASRIAKNKYEKFCKKTSTEELKELINEIDSDKTIEFEHLNVFLLDDKLIELSAGIKIIPYDTILWIYPKSIRNYGIKTKRVYIYDKEFKLHQVSEVGYFRIKYFDEMYQELVEKLPNVMCGYTKENSEKFKSMKQEHKVEEKETKKALKSKKKK